MPASAPQSPEPKATGTDSSAPKPEPTSHRSAKSPTPARPSRSEAPERPKRRFPWAWLVALGMTAFAVFLVYETNRLQTRTAALEVELGTTRAALAAYRTHLDGARDRAAGLRGQLEEFEAFLASDPAAAE